MMKRMLTKKVRRAIIITAAVDLANKKGLHYVTPTRVAEMCMVVTSVSTCRGYFTLPQLWAAILADKRASKKVKKDAILMGMTQ